MALRVDADGDEDADVLHASAPGALVPHAVHEHVRVFGFQWPGAPSVDVVIHALELVGKGLGWHPVTPQQFADVVDLTGVLTPARYISINASSTLDSRLRQRSMTADSKTAPLSFGTLSSSLPAFAVSVRS